MSGTPTEPYPLMRPDQRSRLEATGSVYAEVVAQLPRLAAREEIASLRERLARLQTLMGLDCLRIGLLGSSGAGKSTTVANLLGIPEHESPTPPGGGGAGTGVATRIRPAPPGSPVRMRLEFMDREAYNRRVSDLVGLVPELGEAEPSELLHRARALPPSSPARPEEVRSLIRLLEAFQGHGHLLGTFDDTVPYEDRAQILMHQEAGTATGFTPLLRQVIIEFPTDRIDPRLELIDLPGLGVANRADEMLTVSFLPELNGAFILIKAASANDEQVARLIAKMKEQFPDLGPRVWVIASGFDSLDSNNLGDGPSGRPVLSHLSDYLIDRGVRTDRVLLLGNHLYQALLHAEARTAPASVAPARLDGALIDEAVRARNLKINLPRDPEGRLVVPTKFRRYKELSDAFERTVLVDGGIGRLRDTIKEHVFKAVQVEVQGQVDAELAALGRSMALELESARVRSHMEPADLIRASQWMSELQDIGRNALQRSRDLYLEEATKLEAVLGTYLESVIKNDLPIQDPDHPNKNMLDMVHRQHSKNLRDQGLDLAPRLVRSIFERIDGKVQAIGINRLGTGPVGLRDPKAAWEGRTAADRADSGWYRAVFDSFQDEMKFVKDLEEAASVYPKDHYLELMRHKVQAVVREFIRTVLGQLGRQLKTLGDELLLIGDSPDEEDSATDLVYSKLLDKLSMLGGSPSGVTS
ncbi:P-loop NTPase family protein [Tautonia plasticadhaerens]|uniref:Dynamin family protein n=1 Tax=Tautonia plasticadhaerens TaxID=2527974 RepID=A0A518H631_9BACT|nr:hypothetical protein [Tautonia plasticadhaerens]QDV36297.1 hypothetical protein ElP_42170 [Tautonia plasticadhaerens]